MKREIELALSAASDVLDAAHNCEVEVGLAEALQELDQRLIDAGVRLPCALVMTTKRKDALS